MTQGLNSNVQAMTQAEKTLLRYQYVLAHTTDIQGDFARTSSTWANQVKLLKMQFQALGAVIGGAFINMLRPVLQKLTAWMNTVIKLVQKVVNAIGKLLGWQMEITEVSATDPLGGATTGAEEFGQGLDDDTEKAKKLKQQLLGIDELNVLTTDQDEETPKGSGGGSGDGAGGGVTGGNASGGKVTFKPYESDIKDWYDLGKKIAKWITDALNSIDWDSIQQKAREIAEKIADFINGFLDYEPLWIAIGHTIAQGMNTALYFAETLLDKIHWAQMGKDIGLMLNQWAREFDWAALGRVLAKGINAFFTVIYEAGKEFDPVLFGEGVYTAINNFFETLDTGKIANALNVWADNIFKFITTVINGLKWETIWDKAKTFLETINVRAVSLIFGGLLVKGLSKKALLGAVANAIGMPLGALGYVGTGITIAATIWFTLKLKDDVTERFKKFNEAGGFSGTLEEIAERWKKVAKEAAEANKANPYTAEKAADMQAFRDWIQQIKDKFTETHEATKKYFDDLDGGKWSWATVDGLLEKIQELKDKFDSLTEEDVWDFITIDGSYLGQFKSFSEAVDGIKQSVSDAGSRIKEVFGTESTWLSAFGTIKPAMEQAWQEFVTWWETSAIGTWFETNVAPWFTLERWLELGQAIYDGISQKWNEFTAWWSETGFATWWSGITSKFSKDNWMTTTDGMKTGTIGKWNEFTANWRTLISSWFTDDVDPKFSKETWEKTLEPVETAWNDAWTNIKDTVNGLVDELSEHVTGILETLAQLVQNIVDGLGTARQTVENLVEKIGNGTTVNVLANYGLQPYGKADGGFLNTGDLFYAGEAGPEVVMHRTGGGSEVINDGQMASLLEAAAYSGFSRALQQSGGLNPTVTIAADSKGILKAVRNEAYGFRRANGYSPLPG